MNVDDTSARSAKTGAESLVTREPGYSVAAMCLRVQKEAEANDPTLRSPDGIRLHKDAWSWYQGALGEIQVGRLLTSLGPEWKVLHSVPIGDRDTDVDHILVGPNGVFVLNTKHHAGASIWVGDVVLMVNGDKTFYLKQAGGENRRVAARLAAKVGFPVTVKSAIVTVGQRSIKDIRSADARPVEVMSADSLLEWVVSQPATSSPTEVELIRLAAEQPDTWHIDPHRADNLRIMHRFERLHEAVQHASTKPKTSDVQPKRASAAMKVGRPSRANSRPPRVRAASRAPNRQDKRSERRTKALAEAIVAVGFLAVVVTMVNNETWMPFVTGLITALSPTP